MLKSIEFPPKYGRIMSIESWNDHRQSYIFPVKLFPTRSSIMRHFQRRCTHAQVSNSLQNHLVCDRQAVNMED